MSYQYFPRPHGSQMSSNLPHANVGQQAQQMSIIPAGTTVLTHYSESTWYFGVVQCHNILRNGALVYQVSFGPGEVKTIAGSHVLTPQSNNQNIEVGTRVVVQHPIKSLYISSLIAELPSVDNYFRYLLFLDDGSACYKTKDKLWIIDLVENPILMLPPNYKAFIQNYFISTGVNIQIYKLNVNDTILCTSYENVGLKYIGKVMELDCNIALVSYGFNNSVLQEWIYRGSTRILSIQPNTAAVSGNNSHPLMKGEYLSLSNSIHSNVANEQQSSSSSINIVEPSFSKFHSKSVLKSKQFMLPPMYDPFSFSDDNDDQKLWGTTQMQQYNQNHENFSTSEINHTGQNLPIIVVDDSPMKNKEPSPKCETIPEDSKPVNFESHENIMSPNVAEHDHKISSVFSWSAPHEFESKRKLEFSPKQKTDFDFGDTILGSPAVTSQESDPLSAKPWEANDEIIIIDDSSPVHVPSTEETTLKQSPRTPEKVQNNDQFEVIYINDTPLKVKSSLVEIVDNDDTDPNPGKRDNESSNTTFPIILHQETCDSTEHETLYTKNGSTIEVTVGQNNGETIISVGTPLLEPQENGNLNGVPSPPKSRKRRLLSPKKSPVTPIPKLKINLKSISDGLSVSKDLAAQKCVKRAIKQQSKDNKKQCLSQFIKKQNKIKNGNQKENHIKINPDVKLSEWTSPWSSLIKCKGHPNTEIQNSIEMFKKLLQKVDTVKFDEELEEGELESDSDNEEDDEDNSPKTSKDHVCSLLCNNFNPENSDGFPPLTHPIRNRWGRRIKLTGRKSTVTYVTPCGKLLTSPKAVQTFLNDTKCSYLTLSNFCFDGSVSLDVADVIPDFEPLFSDNDLSNGLEGIPIPFVSNIGPIIKYNFQYILDLIVDFKPLTVDKVTTYCTCDNDCRDTCACTLLSTEFVMECNNNCSCSLNCPNRRSQRRLKQKLKIVQRDTKFHVYALHDIPFNTTVCSITGVVKKSPSSSRDFIFPLYHCSYLDPKVTSYTTPSTQSKLSDISSCLYHEASVLKLQHDSEVKKKTINANHQASFRFNPLWISTLLKHKRSELFTNPKILDLYPSCLQNKRIASEHSKVSSPPKTKKVVEAEYYLDCTEFGNVGRFIRIGCDFNAVIEPVFVDSETIPILLITTCKTVLAQSEPCSKTL